RLEVPFCCLIASFSGNAGGYASAHASSPAKYSLSGERRNFWRRLAASLLLSLDGIHRDPSRAGRRGRSLRGPYSFSWLGANPLVLFRQVAGKVAKEHFDAVFQSVYEHPARYRSSCYKAD